jgi:hypothetical protein
VGAGVSSARGDQPDPTARAWLQRQGDRAPAGQGPLAPGSPGRVCDWSAGARPVRALDRGGALLRQRGGAQRRERRGPLGACDGSARGPIEISVPADMDPRPTGIRVHRRTFLVQDRTTHRGIPVTSPVRTLIDLAVRLDSDPLEAAVNEADKRDLVDPESLRVALERRRGQPGVRVLCELLDRRTFVLGARADRAAIHTCPGLTVCDSHMPRSASSPITCARFSRASLAA